MRETREYIEQLFGDRYFDGNHKAHAVEQKVLAAIDKQTALKPVMAKREVVCPTCRTLVGSTPYCAYCGQKLDHGGADAEENSLTETEKLKIEIEALKIANAKMYEAFLKQPEEIFEELEGYTKELLTFVKNYHADNPLVDRVKIDIYTGYLSYLASAKKKYTKGEDDNG